MNASILTSVIVACALSAPIALAQEQSTPAKPAMQMDMGKPAQGKPASAGMTMDMDMQKHMAAMQAMMDRIHKTTDPKERQKLMQEHMQAMQETMTAMRGMGGPMMKGDAPSEGMMGGMQGGMKHGDTTDDSMEKRQEMMEDRMDMMQMMMDQMMQSDQVMQSQSMPHM